MSRARGVEARSAGTVTAGSTQEAFPGGPAIGAWRWRSRAVAVSAFLFAALPTPPAVGAAGTQPVARTFTFTVDTLQISEPSRTTGVEQTVVVTVTANPAAGAHGIGAPIDFSGTAKQGTPGEPLDYVALGAGVVSIPAGQSSGSTTLRFQTTDDQFWEGTETIVLSADLGGTLGHVVPVSIDLLDQDPQPKV